MSQPTFIPEEVSGAVVVAVSAAAVHAQDGGGVEGDDGVAGKLAEEDEDGRDEDPRGREPSARRSPRFGVASVITLALLDVLKHGNVFAVELLQRSVGKKRFG